MAKRGHEHHVFFYAAQHRSMEPLRQIRENKWHKPPLDHDPHKELHDAVDLVPCMDQHTARRTLKLLDPIPGDYIGSMYAVMGAIEEALKHPKTSDLAKALGGLTIHAIELQIPYVREGLIL